MFRAWCDKFEQDVLVWPSNIEDITNTDRGIVLNYQCVCGKHGQMHTGSVSPNTVTGHIGL